MIIMGAGPDLLPDATAYLQIIYAGIPFMFGMFVVAALLNGVGDTVTPMKLMGVSVALNILLDPLLIFGWGPFPAWGVAGAAIATIISRGIVALIGIGLLFSGRSGIHIRPRYLRLRWDTVHQIVAIGGPASLGQAGTALGFSIMTGILARFGTAVVSAFGIGNRIISIALMPAMGLGQATATIVGQNLGAGLTKRAERSAWTGMGISTAVLVTASVVVLALRASLVRIFINDSEVIVLGARMLILVSIAFPFMGIIQVIIGTYHGSGHTIYSMFFSLFRLWVLRIPLVYLLGFTMKFGPDGVWWAMLASNFGAATLSLGWFLTGNWKHRVIKEPSLAVDRIVEEAATLRR
jgi:putative MATE family efflux protein